MHRHGLTHNDGRPYKCGWPGCDYASKQREHLQTHQLKHSDARPFQVPRTHTHSLALATGIVLRHIYHSRGRCG
jgi:hypothetical protein